MERIYQEEFDLDLGYKQQHAYKKIKPYLAEETSPQLL